jgi:hypothetical protein
LLYFAYTALISPDRMSEVAPGAEFQFIAHLPSWGLTFPIDDAEWGGGLPSVEPHEHATVWGAVFKVPEHAVEGIDAAEQHECRARSTLEAMDRSGKRHQVTTHLYPNNGNGHHAPSAEYVKIMLEGSRHWQLPAGWIAGLEEHLELGR